MDNSKLIIVHPRTISNKRKKDFAAESSIIEEAVVDWLWEMYEKEIFVSDRLIKERARRRQPEANETLPPSIQLNLTFSNGWLKKFERRKDFKLYRSHGEAGDANTLAIELELTSLQPRLQQYHPSDISNADEFGLCYNMPLSTTIGPGRLRGRKKQKQPATFLPCCNSDGSERLPPLVLGHARNPRSFNGVDVLGSGLCIEVQQEHGRQGKFFSTGCALLMLTLRRLLIGLQRL